MNNKEVLYRKKLPIGVYIKLIIGHDFADGSVSCFTSHLGTRIVVSID
jgi:hypothetical protein